MTKSRAAPGNRPPTRRQVARACLLLALLLVAVAPAFLFLGFSAHGATGVAAALVALATCLGGSMTALVLTLLAARAPGTAMLGPLVEMGVPLAVGVAIVQASPPLREAGAFEMIVIYFLLALMARASLSVWLLRSGAPQAGSSTKAGSR